ncbi:Phospho-2-dehydro-3-deoxyheptonate aldolase [Enhygromyxa salina]|uniref:Phospho-2-dehydro-3-deoxyheptonate aldolase n=1 Tax=Enhygromyxa salina TaxID=215803 RepID=A0A2S9XDG5_9BACT|nr:3-deoxy-7-phosphoheptulonate synthase class II [Enhygromyxa salina]PRP90902.1 Phospho-2-dehydro-3-deoxyheptonate aldolase [Enhygromyxa salina]
MTDWTPNSWRNKQATQQAVYPDPDELERVLAEIAQLPPLVTSWEVEALKSKLARAGRGEAFLLQGGDCAESFDDCRSDAITAKLKILLQMSLVLVHGARKPVIRVARMAGQYAKPRSRDSETRDGETLPAYRGDLVNRHGFTSDDRIPNPNLMLRGYERAAVTLNFIRALADGGFADLHHPENWDLDFAKQAARGEDYEQIVNSIRDAIDFLRVVAGGAMPSLQRVDFYTSHEALALNYEMAQTRKVPNRRGWYNLSTHLPWIGMRTAAADGAHVEYCRGIRNPIGVKVGPGMTAQWLTELLDLLCPDDEPGRIALIHRMGAENIAELLPPLIETVRKTGKTVTWVSDPMHGNTETTEDGIKTRHFDNILSELEQAFDIHAKMGSTLGGVHFELTGENVTECVGGARGLEPADLGRAYLSRVDPRLNYEQSLEMALLIARRAARARAGC